MYEYMIELVCEIKNFVGGILKKIFYQNNHADTIPSSHTLYLPVLSFTLIWNFSFNSIWNFSMVHLNFKNTIYFLLR